MSFSGQVKEELAKCTAGGKHCQFSEMLAIKTFSARHLEEETAKWEEFPNEIELSARKFFTLLKKTDNIRKEITALTDITRSCCKRAFLRGAFLCVGSISDPGKSNHLEFVCANEEMADLLIKYMAELLISFKIL